MAAATHITEEQHRDANVAVRRASGRRRALPHLTAEERAAMGKAARAVAPRASHGDWAPAADRRDPVELLEEQAASRVPELVPIRYGRMLVSPFTFFRGAAYPMAADLAGAPRTGLRCSSAAMRTCRTSVGSPRPTGGSCSASTTSTRRCRVRSSGTSSAWPPASPSPAAIAASTPNSGNRSTGR